GRWRAGDRPNSRRRGFRPRCDGLGCARSRSPVRVRPRWARPRRGAAAPSGFGSAIRLRYSTDSGSYRPLGTSDAGFMTHATDVDVTPLTRNLSPAAEPRKNM